MDPASEVRSGGFLGHGAAARGPAGGWGRQVTRPGLDLGFVEGLGWGCLRTGWPAGGPTGSPTSEGPEVDVTLAPRPLAWWIPGELVPSKQQRRVRSGSTAAAEDARLFVLSDTVTGQI